MYVFVNFMLFGCVYCFVLQLVCCWWWWFYCVILPFAGLVAYRFVVVVMHDVVVRVLILWFVLCLHFGCLLVGLGVVFGFD